MIYTHGGDIYTYYFENHRIPLDFSANINPVGIPDGVKKMLHQSIDYIELYPDALCRELRRSISEREGIDFDCIYCGAGASDIIYRLAGVLKIKQALVLAPTFSEYEKSLQVNSEVVCYYLDEKDNFDVKEDILDCITDDIDAVYICNPNNPTGRLINKELLMKLLKLCEEKGIYLIADECFIEFCQNHENITLKSAVNDFKSLIVLRAFTKIYAMAGLRLGYCFCSRGIADGLYDIGAPWNVSALAQKCGIAALNEQNFIEKTISYTAAERSYLTNELIGLGFKVFESSTNFILFRNTAMPQLGEELRKRSVLIRSCSDYRGLDDSFFRIAVKRHSQNEYLIACLNEIKRDLWREVL